MSSRRTRWVRAAGRLARGPREALVLAVRAYQVTLSPWLGGQCRYLPTCSEYAIQSLRRYGALRGGLRALRRLLRCHPWSRGGYDPVK